jgi:hypothetical protein
MKSVKPPKLDTCVYYEGQLYVVYRIDIAAYILRDKQWNEVVASKSHPDFIDPQLRVEASIDCHQIK